MTNHTPGPWQIGFGGMDGDTFATITSPMAEYPICQLEPRGYSQANAQLIARAPTLLAENARLREALTDIAQNRGNTCCNRLLCSERAARALAVERAKV